MSISEAFLIALCLLSSGFAIRAEWRLKKAKQETSDLKWACKTRACTQKKR